MLDFSGEFFFTSAASVWKVLIQKALLIMLKNPVTGKNYSSAWKIVEGIYDSINLIAVSMFVLFFVYGFLRDCVDIKNNLTAETTIKMFIRLIICSNVMTVCLTYMTKFIGWATQLTGLISLDSIKNGGFLFDGKQICEQIDSGLVSFLLGFVFLIVVCVSGFIIILTVVKRILKIYMVSPFAAIALSTLAAGGGTAQTGYQYIKAFLGYTFSILLIVVAMAVSPIFIAIFEFPGKGILSLLEACIRVVTVASAVKSVDTICQKSFGL